MRGWIERHGCRAWNPDDHCGDSPAGRPKPLARWLPATGGSPLRVGLADRSPVRCGCLPFGPRAARFGSARAPVGLGPRAPRRVRPEGLGDAHELARKLGGVPVPELEVFACARLNCILSSS